MHVLFFDWMTSARGQECYIEAKSCRLPANSTARAADGLPSLDELNLISYDAEWAGENRSCLVRYFTENIIQKEFNTNYQHIAGKITNLSEREQEMIMLQCDESDFNDIKSFVTKLAEVIKVPALKIDNVIDKWMYLYGANTVFGLEYYPALSAMLTDAYCGAYINNQKTIEKVVGNTLVSYTKNVIAKGGTLV